MRRNVTVMSLFIGVGLAAAPGAASADGTNGPVFQTVPAATAYAGLHPEAAPSGSNDWTCEPSAAHPRPVVLVHGTWANQFNSFAYLSPRLKAAGYCVFSLNYGKYDAAPISYIPGVNATAPVMDSAQELGLFVDRVRTEIGVPKVDLIGYSQGAIVARGYLKFFGGADATNPANNHVQTVVTYAGTNHGTTLSGTSTLGSQLHLLGVVGTLAGPAATDQVVGSDYVTSLNAGGDTLPGIDYTVLTTRHDEVSTPYRNSFLTAGPGATVHNVVIQDGCIIDGSDHLSIPYSLRAADYTLKALDPATARTIRCALELPAI